MSEGFQPPRGTRDLLGPEAAAHRFVEETALRVLARRGYEEIRTPVFEAEALFSRAVGETTDIVQKELYAFRDRKGRPLALRPEGTAPAVRALLAAGRAPGGAGGGTVVRWAYAGPMFRYERPQAGRYRQFHQIGAECFGSASPWADVEVIEAAVAALAATGLSPVVRTNHLGCRACRPAFRAALLAFLEGKALCQDCARRKATNPLRVLDCKRDACRAARAGHPVPADYLCDACAAHRGAVEKGLDDFGIAHETDPALVRGLDYYTRTVFEVTDDRLGAQDAVLGGGRYDDLVEALGGPPTPAVGFAAGVERWVSLLPPVPLPPVLEVVPLSDADRAEAFAVAAWLRRSLPEGIAVRAGLFPRPPAKALRAADREGVAFVVLFGEDERVNRRARIKRLSDGVEFPFDLPADPGRGEPGIVPDPRGGE